MSVHQHQSTLQSFETAQYKRDIGDGKANNNQSLNRSKEITRLLVEAVIFNCKQFIITPQVAIEVEVEYIERSLAGVAESIKHFCFITLQFDTDSQKRNKGEMSTVITCENGKAMGVITGWSKWKYTASEPVISCQPKAEYIVDNMKKMSIIPTDLTNDDICNHIVVVYATGDGLYGNIIEYINNCLKKKFDYEQICIWKCLTGDAHIDDGHQNLNAYDTAKQVDKATKANLRLVASVTNFLQGCKGSAVIVDILGQNITFG